MPTQGPFAPTVASNDSAVGAVPWLDQGNLAGQVSALDGKSASTATGLHGGEGTRLLKATAFKDAGGNPPSVPADALNVVATFTAHRRRANANRDTRDFAARLVVGGAVQADDHASADAWPTTTAPKDYAFPGLAPSDVNDPGFGFALAAKNYSAGPVSSAPYIDYFELNVSYDLP